MVNPLHISDAWPDQNLRRPELLVTAYSSPQPGTLKLTTVPATNPPVKGRFFVVHHANQPAKAKSGK